ncbi:MULTISPECIES: alpha/beta fold hydrolase [Kitasatospora]|uniref:Alpha/beta hydrolase n=1 Tax=Kitasatospora cystarginea TaxID=58350 RepID=A0ABN3E2J1_9ACTN
MITFFSVRPAARHELTHRQSGASRPARLGGGLDWSPLPEHLHAFAALLPAARAEVVVQPGGGHYPRLDDPAAFTGAVAAFPT